MNEELELTSDQKLARDAFAALEIPAPEAGYRARLKQAFMEGSIEPVTPAADAEPAAAPARTPSKPRSSRFDWLRGSWDRVTWAAALATIVMLVSLFNRGGMWELTAIDGRGTVIIAGESYSMDDPETLAHAIKPGVRVQVPDGAMLEFRSAGLLAFRLTPGTDATIPSVPGRWFGRSAKAEVFSGIMRVTTAKGFEGARMAISTPNADVELTGTTMAVICEPAGTCVCVLEGTVKIGEKGGEMNLVAEGQRRFIFADDRPAESADIRPMESVKLTRFRDELQSKI